MKLVASQLRVLLLYVLEWVSEHPSLYGEIFGAKITRTQGI